VPNLHEIVRLMFVLYCGGLFWMALVFLIEKISKGSELQASIGFGVAVLVLSAYLLIGAVSDQNAVAFLVPPPLT
jgi:hypothetical protein